MVLDMQRHPHARRNPPLIRQPAPASVRHLPRCPLH